MNSNEFEQCPTKLNTLCDAFKTEHLSLYKCFFFFIRIELSFSAVSRGKQKHQIVLVFLFALKLFTIPKKMLAISESKGMKFTEYSVCLFVVMPLHIRMLSIFLSSRSLFFSFSIYLFASSIY